MTEGLATPQGLPPELNRLHGLWSDGGAGILLSGNIQVEADHLERPGNVIVDSRPSNEMQAALHVGPKQARATAITFGTKAMQAARPKPT